MPSPGDPGATSALRCEACGQTFALSAAVRGRYPGWTPRRCMDCREPKATATSPRSEPPKSRPATATKELNLPVAEILERFSGGPQSGVFTDGSCQGNPGPGGWGAVLVRNGTVVAQRHGADPATTNNRMELTAMIAGLEMVAADEAIDVYSDSDLIVKTLTLWAAGWEKRGWRRNKGKGGEVKNLDLVQRAYALAKERPLARIQWIRAHDGARWNEYADALSTAYLRDAL